MKVVQFLLSVVKDGFTVELFNIMHIQLKQNLHFFKDFFMTLISSLKVFIFVKRLFYLSVLIENFQSLKILLSCRIFLCRNSSHRLSNLTVIYNFINVNANKCALNLDILSMNEKHNKNQLLLVDCFQSPIVFQMEGNNCNQFHLTPIRSGKAPLHPIHQI